MKTLDDLMIDVPVFPSIVEEKEHINPSKEYFAVTLDEFLIYSRKNKCWYCLRTKLVVEGNVFDIIDEKGDMFLYIKGKKTTHGKWGTADNIDDILDFYNSGMYLEWLASLS